MSVFDASGLKDGNATDANVLISLLEDELPMVWATNSYSTLTSISSATFADLLTTSVTVELDEIVTVNALITLSHGTLGSQGKIFAYADTVSGPNVVFTESSASSAGDNITLHARNVVESVSGTITCGVQWRRVGGAGTVYSLRGILWVTRAKKRT